MHKLQNYRRIIRLSGALETTQFPLSRWYLLQYSQAYLHYHSKRDYTIIWRWRQKRIKFSCSCSEDGQNRKRYDERNEDWGGERKRRRWLKCPSGIVWKSDDERCSLARPITLFSITVSLLSFPPFPPSSFDRTYRVATLVLTAEISPAFSFSRGIRDKYQSLRPPLNPLGPSRASSFSPSLLDLPYVFAVDRLTRVARSHSRDSR